MAEEQDKKARKLLDRENTRAAKLAGRAARLEGTLGATEGKLSRTEIELAKTEVENKKLAKQNEKLTSERESGSGRIGRATADGAGSTVSMTINAAQQGLLDYLIKKFPESFGKYQVIAKGFPPMVGLIWYLYEIMSMKRTVTWGKQMRFTASNTLANVGLVYLGQAYFRDRDDKRETSAKLGQGLEEVSATNEQLSKDLAKAKKLLKDKGVVFDETSNG